VAEADSSASVCLLMQRFFQNNSDRYDEERKKRLKSAEPPAEDTEPEMKILWNVMPKKSAAGIAGLREDGIIGHRTCFFLKIRCRR